ncbi:hypothetical protein V0288_07140 [Pannus brasiliensis CCIBt3594]|uniref:Uncharacterized protein n=1 Tax=Pannus brasiliensis CCIBt3594 TaxID=1427578 RepID=A0AAW9QGJ3_9CHRO
MSKSFNIFPWLASVGIAWSLGFVYNVIYGGDLSWLRMMYREKEAIAASIQGPHRLIVTAGSGAHYSINSDLMQKELGIPVVNFGLQGDIGLNVISAMILEQARPGDTILLIPEYLMLMDEDGFGRGEGLWGSAPFGIAIGQPGLGGVPPKTMIEDTWLLGIPGMRALTKSTVDLFTKGRMTGYLSDPITDKGDPTVVKERTGKWWKLGFQTPASPHCLEVIAKLRKDLEAKGANLIVALPWVYAHTDPKTVASIRKSAEELEKIVPTIYDKQTLNIQSDSSLFADTHYHLLPPARITRSRQLISELKPLLSATKTVTPQPEK